MVNTNVVKIFYGGSCDQTILTPGKTDSTSNCSDANGPEYIHKLPVTPEEISNLIESAIPQSTRGQIRLSDPSVNLLTQPTNVKCRKVLDSVMKKRSAEGLGAASRRKAEPISSLGENILWERAVIGPKDEVDAFYFKPLVDYTTDQWFCKVPVGHNILQKTLKRLCTTVGFEGKRTNYSLRASTATRLYQTGVGNNLFVRQLVRRYILLRN
ncbi:unnamed protein product [Mytilus coruscus]|uniref:Uncharacterized protein n=1 Tax=Mytilus coruscus TaxID=42192 RepID=A0A6J8AJJ0_MYTCO|nr:unnamed protein product [Mytilus coruscus]